MLNVILSGTMIAEQRSAKAEAQLAVMSERDRLSQDLHDSIGHTLTVVSIKSELAERLMEQDPRRAKAELRDVRQQLSAVLGQVRNVVGIMQTHDLATQLTALERSMVDAGIDLKTHGDPLEVSPDLRPVFSWILREAGTNILRHSGAHRASVKFRPTAMVIHDDGSGGASDWVRGTGLRGMYERAERSGLALEVVEPAGGGTQLAVHRRQGR